MVFSSGGLFKPITRGQFLYDSAYVVAQSHWMTASNIVCGTSDFLDGSVQQWKASQIEHETRVKNQICSFLKPTADIVDVPTPTIAVFMQSHMQLTSCMD